MRISRSALVRLILVKDSFRWRCLQLAILVSSFLILIMYFQEKFAKEALIREALENGIVDELVKPQNDTIILNGFTYDKRNRLTQDKNPFIVIGVTSLPENFFRRDTIRRTWANKAYENYGATILFFLGKPSSQSEMATLNLEAKEYGDLIVDDFRESYYGLSIKTLRLLKYFKFYHSKARFLVKTDDDVFVNVQNLVHYCYIQNHDFESRFQQSQQEDVEGNETGDLSRTFPEPFYFLAGVIHHNRGPHTWNAFSKWYAPANVWHTVYEHVVKEKRLTESEIPSGANIQDNMYPPYAEGNFYVISDDTVVDLLDISRKVPLYHLEDVFVTGILATWMLGIQKENMPFVSSASNAFPTLSYWWYTKSTPPEDIIAFHCDNHVELIKTIYKESHKIYS